MLQLIYKDILLQKKMALFALGYSIFILIAFQNPVFGTTYYIIGAMAISYMFLLGACAYEEKNKSEVFLNSLPLTRDDIVKARYLSVFVFMFLALTTIGGLGAVMKLAQLPFPPHYLSLVDILAVSVSLFLLSSIYLPVFFKFGYIQSRLLNIVFFLLFFFAPNLLIQFVHENIEKPYIKQIMMFINQMSVAAFCILTISFVLLLMYLSYLISLKVYRQREF